MQFLVIGRLIDAPVARPPQEFALLKATFEHFRSGQDSRSKAVYPFADQRATALVGELESGEELAEVIGSLPTSRLSTFDAHPITSPETVPNLLSGWERALAGQ